MNKTIIILIFAISFSACNQQHSEKNKKATRTLDNSHKYISEKPNTTLSGIIDNASRDYIVLSQDDFKDTAVLDNNGAFKFELHLEQPEYFILSDSKSNIRVFLEPAYNLKIGYNASDTFNSITFNGDGEKANAYLKDKYLLMLDHALPLLHLYEMPAKEFRFQVDSLYVISKMFFDQMVDKSKLPQVFKETELASLKYERATKLLEYFINSNHKITNKKQYLQFMDQLSVDLAKYLPVYEYRSYLYAFIDYKASANILGKNLSAHEIATVKMQTVNAHIANQDVKDFLLYSYLKQHVKYYGYKNTDLLFKIFKLNCKNQQYLSVANKSYELYKNLSIAKPAPNFKMKNIVGKQFSLNDFEGSYIYIDVWASWCLPCRKEAPVFEKLKLKYANKNVVFLSLSIDKTKEEWLDYIKNKNIDPDMHFLVEDKKSFLDSYMIQTIPHFLIIDDKGNLIDNNAPRPSEGKTEWLKNLPTKPHV